MTPAEPLPLLVLGGGIAGLGAADEARRAGVEVVLIERSDGVGGMLRTDRRDGFSFDRGGHRFITSLSWVQERITALLGDRLRVRERRSLVLLDGTTVAYPLELDDLIRRLGIRSNLRALGSYLAARSRARRAVRAGQLETNLEEWLERRFGTYLYRRVFEGYSEKLWGLHPSRISAEWAPERISVPDLGSFLKQMLWPRRSTPRTWAKRYLYPRTGIGEIVESLGNRVIEEGGEIRLRSTVRSLAPLEGGRWRATIEGEHETHVLDVRGVVSTIPLDAFCRLIPDSPPIPTLGQRGLRFTNIAFDQPVPLDATWIYQPDPRSRFSRLQIPAARSPEMVPAGCGSIQLEEPWDAARGEQATSQLEERVAEGIAMLRTLGVELEEPRFAFTTAEPHAYPIYEGNARALAAQTVSALERKPGIAIAGRQGRFRYCFLDRAFAEGVNGARRLLALPPLENEVERTPGDPLPLEAASIV